MTYVPLKRVDDKFIETSPPIESTAWLDEVFTRGFEQQLARNFHISPGTVILKGAEFKNCKVYTPNRGIKDHSYVEQRDGAPVCIGDEPVEAETNISKQSIEALRKELIEVAESEKFYEELRTTLSNNYLPPNYVFASGPEQQLLSTVDLLKFPRLLLVGSPGSGKTSLVRRLVHDLDSKLLDEPQPERLVSLYFQLRDFDSKVSELPKAITRKHDDIGSMILAKSRRGQVLYVFDGFDELNADRRSDFRHWLREFLNDQISVRVIVTSRDVSDLLDKQFADFQKLQIQPFNKSQVYEYCYRYFGSTVAADQFFDQISGNTNLERLLSNPLTLSFSLALYAVRKLLPYNTGELVREIVVQLTERWDEKRGIDRYTRLNARSVRALLGKLAYHLQSAGNFTFNEKILKGLIPFEYNDISEEQILYEIRTATGLLQYQNKRWSFSHRYFQDFFCANYLIERVGGVQDEYHRFSSDRNWATVWRYVGELCSDPELYISFVKGDDRKGPVYTVDKLMAVLLSEDRIGSEALVSLLSIVRKNLKLLASELQDVRFSKKTIIISLSDGTADADTLASFLLNFYHYSKLSRKTASGLYRSIRSLKFGIVLKRVFDAEVAPQMKVGTGAIELT